MMRKQSTTDDSAPDSATEEQSSNKKPAPKRLKIAIIAVAVILLIPVSYAAYVFAMSPEVIRKPQQEHYHFRIQILIDGKAENFAEQKYQTGYSKDNCNASLVDQPIHFHDKKDQFNHIHWEGMTGGMVMKYYGWNYIGGMSNALGYKLDNLKNPEKVTTHGNYLPAVPKDAKFYIYTGDEKGYQEKSFDEWKNQDLEEFFGKTSNFPGHQQNKQSSLVDKLLPKASAHGGTEAGPPGETEEEKLTRINNLVGNVVIFVQKDKPTDQQIKDRFNKLEPLTASTCGG